MRAIRVGFPGAIVVAAIVAVRRSSEDSAAGLTRFGNAWLLAWLGVATVRASRAARAVSSHQAPGSA